MILSPKPTASKNEFVAMKFLFITVILLVQLFWVSGQLSGTYSFSKNGYHEEKTKLGNYISRGSYSGLVGMDSIFNVDISLRETVIIGLRNLRMGKWMYFNGKGNLVAILNYNQGGEVIDGYYSNKYDSIAITDLAMQWDSSYTLVIYDSLFK